MRVFEIVVSLCQKTRKGLPFGLFDTSGCYKTSKNLKTAPFDDKKIRKNAHSAIKLQRGHPLVRSGLYLTLKIEYTKGGPFALT